MIEIINIVPPINIGYQIPNLKRLVNTVAHVLNIGSVVHIMPMKIPFARKAYTARQGCENVIFLNPEILKKDELSNFNIKLIIHEMWHVAQLNEGYLKYSRDWTKVYWKGEEYDNSISHEDRPFEKEAFEAEKKYYSQVKQLLNI